MDNMHCKYALHKLILYVKYYTFNMLKFCELKILLNSHKMNKEIQTRHIWIELWIDLLKTKLYFPWRTTTKTVWVGSKKDLLILTTQILITQSTCYTGDITVNKTCIVCLCPQRAYNFTGETSAKVRELQGAMGAFKKRIKLRLRGLQKIV